MSQRRLGSFSVNTPSSLSFLILFLRRAAGSTPISKRCALIRISAGASRGSSNGCNLVSAFFPSVFYSCCTNDIIAAGEKCSARGAAPCLIDGERRIASICHLLRRLLRKSASERQTRISNRLSMLLPGAEIFHDGWVQSDNRRI